MIPHIFIFMLVFFACASSSAQSLSDLDVVELERQTESKTVSHTNPFMGGAQSAEDMTVEDLQLAGVVYKNSAEAYALISGYLMRAGDKIAGYKIDKIEKDRVTLKRLDDVIVLAIEGGL